MDITILLDAAIKGATLFELILFMRDAIKLIKNHSLETSGVLYENEHTKIDFEKCTVTYDILPEAEEENIKNGVSTILSGVVMLCAFFLEFVVDTDIEIGLHYQISCILLIGFIIAFMTDVLGKLISFVIIKLKNIYAKKRGLVRKLPESVSVIM